MKNKNIWRNKLSLLSLFISSLAVTEAKTIYEVPGTDFNQTIWNNSGTSTPKYGDGVTITTTGSGNGAGIGANAGVYSNFDGDMIVGDQLTIITSGSAADAIRTNPSGTNDYLNSTGIITIGNDLLVRVSGLSADGINANGRSKVIIGDRADFTVGGLLAYAVRATQASEVTVGDNMKVKVNANSSYGVYTDRGSASSTNYAGGSVINIGKNADISTVGNSAHAVYLNNINSSIKIKDNAKILTNGTNSDGVAIGNNGSAGVITIGNNLNIETLKEKSDGIVGVKDGEVNIGNDFILKTNADESTGITAKDKSRIITGNNTNINTLGKKSHGVYISNSSEAVVSSNSLSIRTFGNLSDGVLVTSGGNVTAGILNIETKEASSYGIRLIGDSSKINSNLSGKIHSEGTAIKFQTNPTGVLGQELTLYGTKITNNGTSASFIAGADNDVNNEGNLIQAGGLTPINGNSDQVINSILNLYNSTATAGGNKELLNVVNSSTFTFNNDNTLLTGNIETSSDSNVTVNLKNNSILKGYVNKQNNLNNLDMNVMSSLWNITDNSWVKNLNNSGILAFDSVGNTLTVNEDYVGNNGILNIKTVLEDDNSLTDKLHIIGNTTGETLVNVENTGGNGALTNEGIKIVEVDGNSDGNFTLKSAVQAGVYEYNLYKGGVNTPNDGDWYLRSYYYDKKTPENPEDSNVPDVPKNPVSPEKPTLTYRPGISNYVSAQRANTEQGMLQLATFHQRMGSQERKYTEEQQIWSHAYGIHQRNEGKARFDYKQTITGIQMGTDFYDKMNGKGIIDHAGVILDYSYSNVRFFDDLRLNNLNKNTGRLHAQSVSIGTYYTKTNSDRAYLDLVGMVSLLNNDFKDFYGEKSTQKGWRTGLSAEIGAPLLSRENWGIEPQAQLMYQFTHYGSFSDSYSDIERYDASTLRGRAGVRIFKDFNENSNQVYGIANVVYDFIDPKDITVDNISFSEKYDKTYGEIGGGVQIKAFQSSNFYGDARYQKSFDGSMENAVFNIGFKTEF